MTASELFDFGFYGPVAPGAVAVDLTPYSSSTGYGWTSYINYGAETGFSNPLLSGFDAGTNSSFRVDLPNGTYSVTAYMGNYNGFGDDLISYQGQAVASGLTAPGQFFEPTFQATVSGGQMTLNFANNGGSSPFTLNGLQIAPSTPPSATISGMPSGSAAGTPITLTGSATGSTSSTPGYTYAWSVTKNGQPFATGTGPSFTFTPDDAGTFAASLVATDMGGVSSAPVSATDATSDVAPTAAISGMPSRSAAGTPITLTASATDPASAVAAAGYTYAWSVTKNGQPFATGTGPSFTFTPDDVGTFAASLVATDKNGGASAPASATDATTDTPPTASAGGPYKATSGSALQFSGSATDPAAAIAAAGYTYAWNFGDGSSGGGADPSHTYATPGTYNVGLTVTDKDGGVGTAVAVVTVTAPATSAEGSLLFDFGFYGPVAPGAVAVNLGSYSAAAGYGWTSYMASGSETAGSDPLLSGYESGTSSSFRVDLPNGTYSVTAYMGDYGGYSSDQISYQGQVVASGTSTPGQFFEPTFQATVTGGQMTLNFANNGGSVPFKLNGLRIQAPIAASAGPDQSLNEGGTASFAGEAFPGLGATYTWNFGDGTGETGTLAPQHAYQKGGNYTAQLTVTDGYGDTTSSTAQVSVARVTPTASIVGAPSLAVLGTTYNLAGSATNPSTTVQAAGYSYSWNVVEGGVSVATGTGTSFAFTPLVQGTYTAYLTATDAEGVGGTTSVSFPAVSPSHLPTIQTPNDTIPNFVASPTIYSVASGNWSNPATWSGDRVPGTGDVVEVSGGTTVTYDEASTTRLQAVGVDPQATLQFATSVTTQMYVTNMVVFYGGTLQIGTAAAPEAPNVTATILFNNVAINTATDPSQYGNGLIALGTVTIHGAAKTPTFQPLAAEAHAGDTTLQLSEAETGWRVGDQVYLPDSSQRDYNPYLGYGTYVLESEIDTITSISPDGKTLTLATPLQYGHLGGRDAAGDLVYMPDAVDMTRNVVIRSESGTGTRGETMFTGRADVDIEDASFLGLGRTTDSPADDTTYDASGNVTHVGTNEDDRTAVQFRDLVGPTTPQPDGYQYTFVNNVDYCPVMNNDMIWPIDINNSSYGLIQGNAVIHWAGAGIITETGSEIDNMIADNFVSSILGTGDRFGMGREGAGYWFRGPDNYVVDNVATDINMGGTYSYGFVADFGYYLGNVEVPAYQGADDSIPGQATLVNMNDTPLLDFSGDQVYGKTPNGVTFWWLGTFADDTYADAQPSVIEDFQAWNVYQWGIFPYQSNKVTIDHFTDLGDATIAANGAGSTGIHFEDYYAYNMTISNADIQSQAQGIDSPNGTILIDDSYFQDIDDIDVNGLWTVEYTSLGVLPRNLVLDGDSFANFTSGGYYGPSTYISMNFANRPNQNFIQTDTVLVYNYDGISGDNFECYYAEQAPTYVIPQTTYNADGSVCELGAPVAGLTNAEAWQLYGIAIAGKVAKNATTMANINGLVGPISS